MFITINDHPVWVEVTGAGPAVIAIHGLGGTTTFYDAVAARLSENHRVICFDLTGHGRSPLTAATSIEAWTADLGGILDHFEVASAHVVSHSMGTVIAQTFAAQHPERVVSLTLLGPVRDLPDASRAGLRTRAESVLAGNMADVASAVAAGGTGPATKELRPEIVGYARESLLRQSDEGYAAACEALSASVDADPAAISCRVCVIAGSHDGLAPPEKAQATAAAFANSEHHQIAGIGHWTVIEAAIEVGDMIARFIDQN